MSARLRLRVRPGAPRTRVVGPYGDRLKVEVSAPPEGGRANEALLRFLSEQLDVELGSLSLVRGTSSRDKEVLVIGLGSDEMLRRLDAGRLSRSRRI